MAEKTYHDAAAQLPDQRSRDAFCKAWSAADCMDLYDGELHAYLDTIAGRLMALTRDVNTSRGQIKAIYKMVSGDCS